MTDHDKALAVLEGITADLNKAAEDLRAILAATQAEPREPTKPADTFCAGDWIKPNTSPVWRQINNCAYCWCEMIDGEHVVVALTGPGQPLHLHKHATRPYLTAGQFDRACRAEQDEADDRLHHAEWGAA